MTVVAWIVEGSWPAVIDAVRTHALAETEIVLLHVADAAVPEVAHGAYAGLLGRGHRERDPGTSLEHLSSASAAGLLDAAAERLARPCTRQQRLGRPEREVVAAGEGAELLILARDGDQTRLGPRSIGHHGRFIIDHAPCPVLLVWAAHPPAIDTLPPAPPHPPHRP